LETAAVDHFIHRIDRQTDAVHLSPYKLLSPHWLSLSACWTFAAFLWAWKVICTRSKIRLSELSGKRHCWCFTSSGCGSSWRINGNCCQKKF